MYGIGGFGDIIDNIINNIIELNIIADDYSQTCLFLRLSLLLKPANGGLVPSFLLYDMTTIITRNQTGDYQSQTGSGTPSYGAIKRGPTLSKRFLFKHLKSELNGYCGQTGVGRLLRWTSKRKLCSSIRYRWQGKCPRPTYRPNYKRPSFTG